MTEFETALADDEALARLSRVRAPSPRGNPALAPRVQRCAVCKAVSALEHVAILLYDEDGEKLPTRPVLAYVRSIGMGGSPQKLYNQVISHRNHIDRWLERGGIVTPAHVESEVQKIPPAMGPQRWIDVQQNAIDLGNEALRDLAVRLQSGALETNEVVALAKLGVNAANTRGAMEQKGKALNGIDKLLQLAAGGLGLTPSEGT